MLLKGRTEKTNVKHLIQSFYKSKLKQRPTIKKTMNKQSSHIKGCANGSVTYEKILNCAQNEGNANQIYTKTPVFTIRLDNKVW